jgi:hypothetical protein
MCLCTHCPAVIQCGEWTCNEPNECDACRDARLEHEADVALEDAPETDEVDDAA